MLLRPFLVLLCLAAPARAFTESGSLPLFASGAPMTDGASAPTYNFNWSNFGFSKFDFAGVSGLQTSTSIMPLGKNLMLGVSTATGSASTLFSPAPGLGRDFSATSFQMNYNMGRLTPFVSGSLLQTKPNAFNGMNFGLPGVSQEAKSAGSVSAGFNYAITEKFSFGLAVSAGNVQGLR